MAEAKQVLERHAEAFNHTRPTPSRGLNTASLSHRGRRRAAVTTCWRSWARSGDISRRAS
jgi:hypothetical protein